MLFRFQTVDRILIGRRPGTIQYATNDDEVNEESRDDKQEGIQMDTFREFLQPVGGTDIGNHYTDRKSRNGYIGNVARDHPEDAGGSCTVDLADRYLTSAAVGFVGSISQQSDQCND